MTVRFILTLKNRVATAVRGLDDLCNVLSSMPQQTVDVNVFDDSSNPDAREEFMRICETLTSARVRFRYHGVAEYRVIRQRMNHLDAPARSVLQRCIRPPGNLRWDHAGILNLAFLSIALVASPEDSIVVMDDDIRLRDSLYHGHVFRVEGRKMLQAMLRAVQVEGNRFAGCGYWGRRDVSMLVHQLAAKAPPATGAPRGPGLPWILDRQTRRRDAHKGAGPHGLSFGLLAFRAEFLSCAPLIRNYNEDWIWIRLLGPRPGDGRFASGGVLHAPIDTAGYCDRSDDSVYELLGEILHSAVERCLTGADSFTTAARLLDGEAMQAHLQTETGRLIQQHHAWWIHYARRLGKTRADAMRRRIPGRLLRALSAYRRQIRAWPRIINRLRAAFPPEGQLGKAA